MSVDKFRFVSPGVQVAEIDKSGIPATPPPIGPAVIGRALRGPGMQPIRLESTAELAQVFGLPNPGGETGDVWREGNKAAPTYGLYAAEAYLRNNGPVTFVRLMGEADPDATVAGAAGWTSTGATGLYIVNATSGSDGIGTSGSVAQASLGAVIYTQGSLVAVGVESISNSVAYTSASLTMVPNENSSNPRDLTFTVNIENYKGNAVGQNLTATFNFDPDSDLYIRNVLNTNPQYTNEDIYGTTDALNYWLGETYESSLKEIVVGEHTNGAPTALPEADSYAFIFKNEMSGTVDHNDRADGAAIAKSGIVFSQDLTNDTASYNYANQQQLFQIVARDIRGLSDNTNLKISIANVKAPTNPTINAYGTFDLFVRNASDNDNSMQILESFARLNLDPASPDYIARRIGDQHTVWNTTDKFYETYGAYKNTSKYIRVDVNDQVDNGVANPSCLPTGYYGPLNYVPVTFSSGSAITEAGVFSPGQLLNSGSTGYAGENWGAYTASVSFPKLILRQSGSTDVSAPRKAFYGVQARGLFGRRDLGYGDYTRRLSSDLASNYVEAAGSTQYSYIFSLDDVAGTAANPVYISGSRQAGTSLRGVGTFDTQLLANNINNFTLPMYGGCDGFDIIEPEPFANRLIGSSDLTSYEHYSLRKAVDVIRDPEVVEQNVCTIPGVSKTSITDFLIGMAEERRDTLALIDIEEDYKPRYELGTVAVGAERSSLPDVPAAISAMKQRGFNTSYGAAYYPAIQIRDRNRGVRLFVPATIAAMASFGYTERVAAPWFAPAGFNRGGLSDASSGITATGVTKQLRAADRDDLYEINVNPIAQFPQEGVVIFGQKTLQSTPSALDRINVRRLLIYVKKEISRVANTVLFQPNVQDTWNRFLAQAEPILQSIKAQFGLQDYRLILDESTTTPELIDRNIMYARVLLKPARAIEFIAIDFEIFRSGASFDD